MSIEIPRRALLAGGLIATSVLPAAAAGAYDPRTTAEGQIKLTATLDESPAYWIYTGVVYAVRPHTRPVAILALSGCEAYWAKRRGDGAYVVGGALATFFRDPVTGKFIETLDNPLTGKRNAVPPNILSGGGALYPADGGSARAFGQIKDAVVAPGGFKPADPTQALGAVRWTEPGGVIILMTDRSWNVAVQPQLEAQTQIADRAAFFTPGITKLPASYSATTIVPWMDWMDMGGAPGHLVWHSSGAKVFSPDAIPAAYRARAGQAMDLLTTPPAF